MKKEAMDPNTSTVGAALGWMDSARYRCVGLLLLCAVATGDSRRPPVHCTQSSALIPVHTRHISSCMLMTLCPAVTRVHSDTTLCRSTSAR